MQAAAKASTAIRGRTRAIALLRFPPSVAFSLARSGCRRNFVLLEVSEESRKLCLSHRNRCRPAADTRAHQGCNWNLSAVRQRNELRAVAGHDSEAAGFPIGLGGLDAVFARGYEIPPNMAGSIHRGTADQDEMSIFERLHFGAVARLEHQKLLRGMTITANFDFTWNHVERTLLIFSLERQDSAGCQP